MLGACHARYYSPLGAHGEKQFQRWPVFFPHLVVFGRFGNGGIF
ncbi:hypothetical protein CZ787_06230 [Halomonas citrativorans]|uniref:Uncharacterized protein n=1 Tax=Halomonas citrativorans TaxID=2742612 RepID=A0A1R4HVU1_9GAMM|nr:hypothetical protein CZ787_06230 [Halomonas citrativorans]